MDAIRQRYLWATQEVCCGGISASSHSDLVLHRIVFPGRRLGIPALLARSIAGLYRIGRVGRNGPLFPASNFSAQAAPLPCGQLEPQCGAWPVALGQNLNQNGRVSRVPTGPK
jgi:hypothetical protein